MTIATAETKEAPAAPAVDVAALTKRLEAAEAKAAKFDEVSNEASSMKALLEQAKSDPDAALALAGLDFDQYTQSVLNGTIKPISKEARKQAKELTELQKKEEELVTLRKKEKDRETREVIDKELDVIREEIKEEEYPLVRLLKLERHVHQRFYDKREKDGGVSPKLKDVAKEVHDAVFAETKSVWMNPSARKALLADPDILASVKEALGEGTTTAEAKSVIRALSAPATSKDKSKAAPAGKVKAKDADERAVDIVERAWAKRAKD